jgi:hypothetical protein
MLPRGPVEALRPKQGVSHVAAGVLIVDLLLSQACFCFPPLLFGIVIDIS